jgi:hypothetical protein
MHCSTRRSLSFTHCPSHISSRVTVTALLALSGAASVVNSCFSLRSYPRSVVSSSRQVAVGNLLASWSVPPVATATLRPINQRNKSFEWNWHTNRLSLSSPTNAIRRLHNRILSATIMSTAAEMDVVNIDSTTTTTTTSSSSAAPNVKSPAENLLALRSIMKELDLDVYLVPTDDPHLSGR